MERPPSLSKTELLECGESRAEDAFPTTSSDGGALLLRGSGRQSRSPGLTADKR
jgi:hypothetical protein